MASPSEEKKMPVNILDENANDTSDVRFRDMSCLGKTKFTLYILLRVTILVATLYFFMCSIKILNAAFILIGGRQASDFLGKDSVLTHPMVGLLVGMYTTAILNSSSTTTSICVILVASNIFTIPIALPIVMGANIGTSVSSTMVAMLHAGDRKQFRDAFSAATVHDMFNWLSAAVLLPLELLFGFLEKMTEAIVSNINAKGGGTKVQFVSVLTQPFANLIITVDKKVVELVISGAPGTENMPLIKTWCKTRSVPANVTMENITTTYNYTDIYELNETTTALPTPSPTVTIGIEKCCFFTCGGQAVSHLAYGLVGDSLPSTGKHLFVDTTLTEPQVGGIILVISFIMLIVCLVIMVKTLKSLLAGSLARVIHKTINANFPGKLACLTGYVAIIVGMVVTILIQTSVVTTAALTSLVGLQMVTVDRVFPMTLGANIGTTSTGILAAFATSSVKFRAALQIALCHLFFNIIGIIIWYPLPFMRKVPLGLAKFLGKTTSKYRWFAIFYLIAMFIFFPVFLLVISLPGIHVMLGIGIPIIVLIITIIVINVSQNRCPGCLPGFLKSWDFLPLPLRSLEPYDRVVTKLIGFCSCCKCCRNLQNNYEQEEKNGDVKTVELQNMKNGDSLKNGDSHKPDMSEVKITVVTNGNI